MGLQLMGWKGKEKELRAEGFKKKLKVECSKLMIQGSRLCSAR
jgi:hypothetical protein